MKKAFLFLMILLFMISSQLTATIYIDDYTAANASAPLDIPSYVLNAASQKEVVHPDVVYAPAGWNGYKYWMAYTPFPDSDAADENPCIAVSNDRVNWIEPPGGTNPIDSFASSSSSYNSDTELIFSPNQDTLFCVWRRVANSTKEILYYKSTTNGYTWSSNTEFIVSITTNNGGLISPAIVYQDGKYRMWSVRKPPRGTVAPRIVEYREATSFAGIKTATVVQTNILPYTYDTLGNPISETWHLNVIFYKDLYWMINTVGPYTVSSGGDLYLGYSQDGIHWTFGTNPVLYRRDPYTNWDRIIYRSSILPMNDGSENFYIWYSVQRKSSTPHMIGFTHTTGGATLPVELSAFTAAITPFNTVRLDWVTQSETNVQGFYIYRNDSPNSTSSSLVSDLISGTNTSTMTNYTFVDQENYQSGLYYYWLQNVDFDGTTALHGPISVELNMSPDDPPPLAPHTTTLQNVYPNPFNPTTTIAFDVVNPTNVRIEIYNTRGEKITTLFDQWCDKGNHSLPWDGKDQSGNPQTTGIYFIKMSTLDHTSLRKALLLK